MSSFVISYLIILVNSSNLFVFQIVTQFKEQGLNTELYHKNREMGETFSIVPTSAITYDFQTVGTISSYKLFQSFLLFLASCLIYCVCDYFSGEGIPDLLLLLVQWTQKTMVEKLTFSNEVQVRFP